MSELTTDLAVEDRYGREPPAVAATRRAEEAHAGPTGRFLVPRTPGPLRALDQRPREVRDEIDELVYELFGDPIEESPGKFDAALLVVGGLIVAWSLFTGQSTAVLVLGFLIVLLGLALPLRAARRAVRGRRTSREHARLLSHGQVLDATHPAVRHLVESYNELTRAADLPGTSKSPRALEAAHLALSEVASLLEGRAPVVDAEVGYVAKRTQAVRDLAVELRRSHRLHVHALEARAVEDVRPLRLRAAAVATARDELDAVNPADSLDEMGRVTAALHEANRDVDA
jgi:hypothetical protein